MPPNICDLSFDVAVIVARSLDVSSYVALSLVNRHFYNILLDEATARKCIEGSAAFSRPGRKALDSPASGTCRETISRVHNCREAIRSARPYSASIVARGKSSIYADGVLCYITANHLRMLDIHNASRIEKVLLKQELLRCIEATLPASVVSDTWPDLRILNYADEVLVLEYLTPVNAIDSHPWLVVIDFSLRRANEESESPYRYRIVLKHQLRRQGRRSFVRHSASYLYYGSHSGQNVNGHHEWLIQGFDLLTGLPVSKFPLQLANFVGSEINSTVCFLIHNKDFIAVTNQTSFEAEEIDWTSYFHYIKFPCDEANPNLDLKKVWRRQHLEGPINDAWTDISLQIDEQSNQLLIVEGRKEWLEGGSANMRTYYTEILSQENEAEVLPDTAYPADDPRTRTLDSCSNPSYGPSKIRIPRHKHCEYPENHNSNSQDFFRVKTKFNSYNAAACSFIDLVLDSVGDGKTARPRERLRLRIASRTLKSPLVPVAGEPGCLKLRGQMHDEDGEPIPNSEEEFNATKIHMWPPRDAPAELYSILQPSNSFSHIHATVDDRAIVYRDGPADRMSNIMLVSFDREWGHDGLELLPVQDDMMSMEIRQDAFPKSGMAIRPKRGQDHLLDRYDGGEDQQQGAADASSSPKKFKASSSSGDEKEGCGMTVAGGGDYGGGSSLSGTQSLLNTATPHNPPRLVWWEEPAMYLHLNKGFRLR